MSSYLFIVKYELPEVIRAFLGLEEISGWVRVRVRVCIYSRGPELLLTSCVVLAVSGTWTGTTWWCLCPSESSCLCLCSKIWVRTHFPPLNWILFRHMLCNSDTSSILPVISKRRDPGHFLWCEVPAAVCPPPSNATLTGALSQLSQLGVTVTQHCHKACSQLCPPPSPDAIYEC